MPYIKSKADREIIDTLLLKYMETLTKTGNLNYLLCKMFTMCRLDYRSARNFIGELECAKLELYRRWVGPYEDKKIKENGDVNGR